MRMWRWRCACVQIYICAIFCNILQTFACAYICTAKHVHPNKCFSICTCIRMLSASLPLMLPPSLIDPDLCPQVNLHHSLQPIWWLNTGSIDWRSLSGWLADWMNINQESGKLSKNQLMPISKRDIVIL